MVREVIGLNSFWKIETNHVSLEIKSSRERIKWPYFVRSKQYWTAASLFAKLELDAVGGVENPHLEK